MQQVFSGETSIGSCGLHRLLEVRFVITSDRDDPRRRKHSSQLGKCGHASFPRRVDINHNKIELDILRCGRNFIATFTLPDLVSNSGYNFANQPSQRCRLDQDQELHSGAPRSRLVQGQDKAHKRIHTIRSCGNTHLTSRLGKTRASVKPTSLGTSLGQLRLVLKRKFDQRVVPMQTELLTDVRAMVLDRPIIDEQFRRDFFAGASVRDQA